MTASVSGSSPRRIAIVLQGDPEQGGAWSGVPAGLGAGLREQGVDVVPVNADFRGSGRVASLLRMSWADRAANPAFAALSGFKANRDLRGAGPLDGVVMIGSGYSLSTALPLVTFEDMTVAQGLRQPSFPSGSLRERAGRRWLARQRRNYERCTACCVASRWTARSLQEDYAVPESRIRVVSMGHNATVEAVAHDWSVPRFLFVGHDWVRKRGDAVVTAFAEVRRERPQATLDLVGGHPPIEAPGVVGHGALPLGTQEGKRRYADLLARSTCLVMPSDLEPFGIAYLDAAAAGVPSIGTTVGGAADAIGDGGLVVDPDDQAALTAAMKEMADPENARRYAERALARTPEFTWAAVAGRVLDAIGEAVR